MAQTYIQSASVYSYCSTHLNNFSSTFRISTICHNQWILLKVIHSGHTLCMCIPAPSDCNSAQHSTEAPLWRLLNCHSEQLTELCTDLYSSDCKFCVFMVPLPVSWGSRSHKLVFFWPPWSPTLYELWPLIFDPECDHDEGAGWSWSLRCGGDISTLPRSVHPLPWGQGRVRACAQSYLL